MNLTNVINLVYTPILTTLLKWFCYPVTYRRVFCRDKKLMEQRTFSKNKEHQNVPHDVSNLFTSRLCGNKLKGMFVCCGCQSIS